MQTQTCFWSPAIPKVAIGLDLGDRRTELCQVDEAGAVVEQSSIPEARHPAGLPTAPGSKSSLSGVRMEDACAKIGAMRKHGRGLVACIRRMGADLRTGFSPEYLFDLLPELRNFACDHVPHEFVIHSEIAMNQAIPHASGTAPLHLRMPCTHLVGYPLRGLADDF